MYEQTNNEEQKKNTPRGRNFPRLKYQKRNAVELCNYHFIRKVERKMNDVHLTTLAKDFMNGNASVYCSRLHFPRKIKTKTIIKLMNEDNSLSKQSFRLSVAFAHSDSIVKKNVFNVQSKYALKCTFIDDISIHIE